MRTRLLLLATMLTVATGCDKKAAAPSLASRPPVLFQVFGSKEEPRVVPVAFLDSAGPRAMELTPAEWRELDSLYLRGGDSLTIWSQGKIVGSARVTRGMYEGGTPLYTLPGCTSAIPQATVAIAADAPTGSVVEFLATSGGLRPDTSLASRPMTVGPVAVVGIARELAAKEAQRAKLSPLALDSLDFRALAAHTGATPAPTIITSFVDPTGGDGGKGQVHHALLVADVIDSVWTPTYRNVFADAGKDDRLQRYVDRLDVTGDGRAEIFLEEWTLGGSGSRPVVLSWKEGRWQELWRGRNDWCVGKQ